MAYSEAPIVEELLRNNRLPLPTAIDSPDPVLIEATEDIKIQLIEKARSLIRTAGIIQLPEGAVEPVSFIVGGTVTVQAFSRFGNQIFRTWVNLVPADDYARLNGVGGPWIQFGISEEPLEVGKSLEIQNPVKTAVYKRLRQEDAQPEKYSVADFEKDEFTHLPPEEVKELLHHYTDSTPDFQASDQHYEAITGRNKTPGGGKVLKLYKQTQ